jgi:two-component system sensor histidine kinase VanS
MRSTMASAAARPAAIRSWPGWPNTTPVIVVRLASIQRTARKAKQPPAAASEPVLTPTTRCARVLTVENTGEKLTPQVVAALAEPFLRGAERIRTDHAGAGLGLAIVKRITQAHDGTLTLTPRTAGGLRVTVQLPVAPLHTADDG